MLNILFAVSLSLYLFFQQTQGIVKNTKKADSDVQTYVDDFKNLMNSVVDEKIVDSVKITMADIEHPKVGLCWYENDPKLINLDTKTWNSYSELQKEVLIFHELAHCVCRLEHAHFRGTYKDDSAVPFEHKDRIKAGYLEDGCPVSIMYPTVTDSTCYKKHREHYRYELNLRCYSKKFYKK